MSRYWPIAPVVAANTFYNISAKQTPKNLNPFLALVVTYTIAMAASVVLFLHSPGDGFWTQIRKINWSTIVFGICVVALEFGYLNIYRVGWPINSASIVANITLAVILLGVGVACFREAVTMRQLAGIAVCALGLFLVNG